MITIPATMHFDGARDQNSVTFQMDGHLPNKPKIIIFDRKVPSASAPKESYRVRYICGNVDSEGKPFTPNTVVELSISSHMNADNAEVVGALNALLQIATLDGFSTMAVVNQRLPR